MRTERHADGSLWVTPELALADYRPNLPQELAARAAAHPQKTYLAERRGGAEAPWYRASYGEVDIALDTLPFTGGRTTLDALWMGVPVVALRGEGMYGRYSAGYLNRIGVGELVAPDEAGYVALAADLALSPDRLADYRRRLRDLIRASSLMDGPRHARELEDAYRQMWRRWCAARGDRPV